MTTSCGAASSPEPFLEFWAGWPEGSCCWPGGEPGLPAPGAGHRRIGARRHARTLGLPAPAVAARPGHRRDGGGRPGPARPGPRRAAGERDRAHGQGGEIEVSARQEDGHVVLMVADSGTGIAPADLDRIFRRFARANPQRSSETGGFGWAWPSCRPSPRPTTGRSRCRARRAPARRRGRRRPCEARMSQASRSAPSRFCHGRFSPGAAVNHRHAPRRRTAWPAPGGPAVATTTGGEWPGGGRRGGGRPRPPAGREWSRR